MQGCLHVVVNLKAKKRLVSRMVGVGVNRVWFDSQHLEDIADAITRENIRSLMTANTILIKSIKGTSRGRAKLKKIQRKKRGTTAGLKKGKKGARVGKKQLYVKRIRSLRYLLKVFKDRKEINNQQFWSLYKRAGGNTVRNKAHLRKLVEEIKSKQKS